MRGVGIVSHGPPMCGSIYNPCMDLFLALSVCGAISTRVGPPFFGTMYDPSLDQPIIHLTGPRKKHSSHFPEYCLALSAEAILGIFIIVDLQQYSVHSTSRSDINRMSFHKAVVSISPITLCLPLPHFLSPHLFTSATAPTGSIIILMGIPSPGHGLSPPASSSLPLEAWRSLRARVSVISSLGAKPRPER